MSYSLAFSQSLYIVLFVASKVEQKKFEFISTQLIADKLNIPPSTSSVILRRLKKAGLIEAREGINGGVRLAKRPHEITVLDIFNAVEQSGQMFPTNVNIVESDEKSIRVQQSILGVLSNAENEMKLSLHAVTVKDLMP
ncbi:MAG: Rrf2 family transcriptional regulator [Anaerolineae bacterium]|nr:Rrf2 family transcriptional regulator [Anaerolineae bacterium]